MRIEEISIQAVEEAMEVSQSLANLRQRPSHAKVRWTTQRRGSTSKLETFGGVRPLNVSIVNGSKRSAANGAGRPLTGRPPQPASEQYLREPRK